MTVSRVAVLLAVTLAASVLSPCAWAAQDHRVTAQDGVAVGGSVINSTVANTVYQQDPAILAAMAKTFADQMAATTEAKAQAEAKAAELGTKWGFTSAAVTEVFRSWASRTCPTKRPRHG